MLSRVLVTSSCPLPSCPCSASHCSFGCCRLCFCGQRCIPWGWVGCLQSSSPPHPPILPVQHHPRLLGLLDLGLHQCWAWVALAMEQGPSGGDGILGLAMKGHASQGVWQLPGESTLAWGQCGAGSTAPQGWPCLGVAKGGWGTAGGTVGLSWTWDHQGGQRAEAAVAVHLPCAHTHSCSPGSPRNVAGSAPSPAAGPRLPWRPPSPPGSSWPCPAPASLHTDPLFTAAPPLAPALRGKEGAHPAWGRLWARAPLHGTVHGDMGTLAAVVLAPCPAGELGKATHVCSVPGAGAILTQLPASTFAKAGPWHLAPKPHRPLLACLQRDVMLCVPPRAVRSCEVHWALPPPSVGAPSATGSWHHPSGRTQLGMVVLWAPWRGAHPRGVQTVGLVVPRFAAFSVSCMKGQAGALGAVFQWLQVWGTCPPPHSGAHTWHLPGKVIS